MPKSRNAADAELIARLAALVDEPADGRGRRSHLTRWLTRHRKTFAAPVAVPEREKLVPSLCGLARPGQLRESA